MATTTLNRYIGKQILLVLSTKGGGSEEQSGILREFDSTGLVLEIGTPIKSRFFPMHRILEIRL